MEEVWLEIPWAEGLYQVSNLGRVRSRDRTSPNRWGPLLRRGKILRAPLDAFGYPLVCLRVNSKAYTKKVHRLVAEAFLGEKPGMTVNHKDGDKTNNAVSNLEWVSHSENMAHAVRLNLFRTSARNAAIEARAKLSADDVRHIRSAVAGKTATPAELAAHFGVGRDHIYNIVRGRSWAN